VVKTEAGSVYMGTLKTPETAGGRPVKIQVVENAAQETVCRLRTQRILGRLIAFGIDHPEVHLAVKSLPEFVGGRDHSYDLLAIDLVITLVEPAVGGLRETRRARRKKIAGGVDMLSLGRNMFTPGWQRFSRLFFQALRSHSSP